MPITDGQRDCLIADVRATLKRAEEEIVAAIAASPEPALATAFSMSGVLPWGGGTFRVQVRYRTRVEGE